MATHTYKCPNCDAELTFDPKSGNFICQYCNSSFTRAELDALATAKQAEEKQARDAAKPEEDTGADGSMKIYSCPSCGAELVTDATTAATFCFYCHSPVILTGKLAGKYKPDKVVPFSVDKTEVQNKLLSWCRKKKFIDKRFFDESQMDKLSGVYFPFWEVDSKLHVKYKAKGTDLRTWILGDTEYTETTVTGIDRESDIELQDVTVKALSRTDTELLNGVYPYDIDKAQSFDMAYLSGFYAEKRDIERESAQPEATETINSSVNTLMRESVTQYGSITEENCSSDIIDQQWHYTLLPAWMLTYRYAGETFYFAMNGQTGKIAGRVPQDKKKTMSFGAIIGVSAFVLIMLLRILFA